MSSQSTTTEFDPVELRRKWEEFSNYAEQGKKMGYLLRLENSKKKQDYLCLPPVDYLTECVELKISKTTTY